MRVRLALSLMALLAIGAMITLVACSTGKVTGGGGSTTGTVTTTISDPSTCSAPQGPFSNVFVTIADVQIHQSATAAANDSGWQDLTPGMTPTQIDLLGIANNSCFLASLGSNVAIQTGTYQQIRVILLDNSKASQVANNKCGSNAANCVVLAAGNTIQPLALSSESQTGIKIPSGQIAGGQFTVAAGQVKDLNIDFNACASIVIQGNQQFRLKPVLHAGEVSTTSTSITGKVVDSVTRATIVGGKVIVALEQVDSSGVDRVVMETVPDSSGNFVFCPVPAGTYDVVAIGVNGQLVAYGATVTTGVQPGNALGQVPIVAQTGTTTAATITGLVTAATASNTGASADISLSALQSVTSGSNNVFVTVPQAATSSATLSLATVAGASCPANTQCATYSVQVPALNPSVGAFSASGTTYSSASGAVNYTLDALAFVPNSGNTPSCTPSEQKSATPLTVTAGATVNAPDLAFTGCQ
jgi:hypothetical protein